MDYPRLVGVILEVAIIIVVASLFAFYPKLILKYTARMEGWLYRHVLQVSDEKLDKSPFPTAWGLVKMPRSQFIGRAEEHPEEFGNVLFIFGMIGAFLWTFLILAFALLLWAIAAGKISGW